jgi:hypothetical protein
MKKCPLQPVCSVKGLFFANALKFDYTEKRDSKYAEEDCAVLYLSQ